MMTGQPSRVTPAEINVFMDQVYELGRQRTPSLDELIAFHTRKAELLSRIAAQMNDRESRREANQARDYLQLLIEARDGQPEEGDRR